MGCVTTGYVKLFRKKHVFFTKQAALQLLLMEDSEKNFAQSGTHFYVAEFYKDIHNKFNIIYQKEIGDSV
jgi:hypothetical protein